MKNTTKKNLGLLKSIHSAFFGAVCLILLIFYNSQVKQGVSQALFLCCSVIVPSLFPMLVFSSFASDSGMFFWLSKLLEKPLKTLFGLSPACFDVVFFGLTGGYPVGVKTAAALFDNGRITLREAQLLCLFCANPGAAFAISAAGASFYGSFNAGCIFFICSVISSLFLGMISCRLKKHKTVDTQAVFAGKSISVALVDGVSKACASIISVCAWIAAFSALDAIIKALPFGKSISELLTPFSEITSACVSSAAAKNLPLTAFSLGFGGLCLFCQLLPELKHLKVKITEFLIFRIVGAVISSSLSFVFIKLFPVYMASFSPSKPSAVISSSTYIGSVALLFMCAVFMISIYSNTGGKKSIH